MGSRNDQTTVYWIEKNIQVVCGCFKGNLKQFEEKVIKKYCSSTNEQYKKYYNDYMHYINIVKTIVQMEESNGRVSN